jgi:flagellar hook-associated protein 2
MDLGVSGLASGFDWKTLVAQLADVERAPQTQLRTEQDTIAQQGNAYNSIKTDLSVLQNRVTALQAPSLFDSRKALSSDSAVATVSASAGAPVGLYSFAFTQLATAARQSGQTNIGAPLSATDDVSGLVLDNAGLNTAVTAGIFTVNGKQITVSAGQTLQGVFDAISTATSGAVTAAYDSASDKITLSSSGEIVLGSATDTSNFLNVVKLNNNGSGSVTSAAELGGIRGSKNLSSANFSTPMSDGGSGLGEFKINGVSIQFNVANDSLSNVLDRINNSTAGVTASYDASNDQIVLANKSTGDIGIGFEDVTGNFLAASGLSGGSLEHGKNLLYTINNGGQLISQSNTIGIASSGLTGLSVTALTEGTSAKISVSSDTDSIRNAIKDFLTEYNKVQSLIDSQTASSTDAKGKVTAGILASDSDAAALASGLRSNAYNSVSGLSGVLRRLDDLGITSNGNDNSLTLSDSTKLDSALTNNLSSVKTLFLDANDGIATRLGKFLDNSIGDKGTVTTKLTNLGKQSSTIDVQISDMERLVQNDIQRMTDSFIAMESASARSNQQLAYLQKQFP